MDPRPVGRRRSAGLVGVLHVLTLGLSSLVWLLLASREVDAYQGTGRSHAFAVAALAVGVPALALAFVAGNAENLELAWDEATAIVLQVAGLLGTLSASALAFISLCMVWWPMERAQRDRGLRPDSAVGLLLLVVVPSLVLSLVGPFLFFFGVLFFFASLFAFGTTGVILFFLGFLLILMIPSLFVAVALGRTQSGLNRLWAGA